MKKHILITIYGVILVSLAWQSFSPPHAGGQGGIGGQGALCNSYEDINDWTSWLAAGCCSVTPNTDEECQLYTFCDGQSQFPVMGPIPAINPSNPSPRLATMFISSSGGCSASALGPYTILAAGHCTDNIANNGSNDTVEIRGVNGETGVYRVLHIHTHPGYYNNLSGYSTRSKTMDFTIIHTLDPVPGPYVQAVYDPTISKASCNGLIIHGVQAGIVSECEVMSPAVRLNVEQTPPWDYITPNPIVPTDFMIPVMHGISPLRCNTEPGDSGGPTYAYVDDGAGGAGGLGELQIAAVTSASGPTVMAAFRVKNWINSLWDREPIETTVGGVKVYGAILEYESQANTDAAPVPFTCTIAAEATTTGIDRAGCVIRSEDTSLFRACSSSVTDTNGNWVCTGEIPRYGGKKWLVDNSFVHLDDGTWDRVDIVNRRFQSTPDGVNRGNFDGLVNTYPQDLNSVSPDLLPPVITNYLPLPNPAAGGSYGCVLRANDTDIALGDGIHRVGCVFTSPSRIEPLVVSKDVSGNGTFVVEDRLPEDVTPGSGWQLDHAFALDSVGHIAKGYYRSEGFITTNCANITPTSTVTNGWNTNETVRLVGGDAFFSFYAKATQNNEEGIIAISDKAITDITDARIALRFSAAGTIQLYDNGVWTGTTPYLANTWYQFRITVDKITNILGQGPAYDLEGPPQYTVEMASCGSEYSQIATQVAIPGDRILLGLYSWNTYAATGGTQQVDVFGFNSASTLCQATNCYYEITFPGGADWVCGVPPDGCGGVASDAPCAPNSCAGGTHCASLTEPTPFTCIPD